MLLLAENDTVAAEARNAQRLAVVSRFGSEPLPFSSNTYDWVHLGLEMPELTGRHAADPEAERAARATLALLDVNRVLAPGGLVTFMRCHAPKPGRGLAAADLMALLAESEPSRPFHTVATILGWVSTHNRSVGQLECGCRGTVHAYRKRTP